MKKLLSIILITVFLVSCAPAAAPAGEPAAGNTSAPAAAGGEVVIGVSAPLTGNYAEYGQLWKQAMDMAVEEINTQKVLGEQTLRLQYEDSQSDPKQSATIAKKLAGDNKVVAVIGDFSSSASLAGAPIYLSSKKVQLSPTASDPKFSLTGDYMFSIVGSQKAEAPFLAKHVVDDMGKKNIAVMYINNDWGSVTKDIFVQSAQEKGATIVEEQAFLDTDKDFRAVLTRLQAKNPDVLFVAGFYQQVSLLQKQRQDLGWEVPVVTPSSTYSPELINQGGAAVEGQQLVAVFFPTAADPKVQDFVKNYKDRYGSDPNQFAALAYDAVWLLASTIAKTGPEPTAIRDGLANDAAGFVGVTGPMKFNEDRLVAKNYVPLEVKDGAFQLVQP